MPRKARIDAPGALHHVIIRGIERRMKLAAKMLIIAWTLMKKKEPFDPEFLNID